MKPEEAIKRLKTLIDVFETDEPIGGEPWPIVTALDMAVKALEKQKQKEPEIEKPCIYKYSCGYDFCMMSDCPEYKEKTSQNSYYGVAD